MPKKIKRKDVRLALFLSEKDYREVTAWGLKWGLSAGPASRALVLEGLRAVAFAARQRERIAEGLPLAQSGA